MVRLTRIYTKGGDAGKTSLGNGRRVSKANLRIKAYGLVDELNSVLGMVLTTTGLKRKDRTLLTRVQNDLFDLGADLCVPLTKAEQPGDKLRIREAHVAFLETHIDRCNSKLQPLNSFILPGGTPTSAWLHVARTVCRRTEISSVELLAKDASKVNAKGIVYLNRLSDLLFVLARRYNDNGRKDVLWQPGESLETT